MRNIITKLSIAGLILFMFWIALQTQFQSHTRSYNSTYPAPLKELQTQTIEKSLLHDQEKIETDRVKLQAEQAKIEAEKETLIKREELKRAQIEQDKNALSSRQVNKNIRYAAITGAICAGLFFWIIFLPVAWFYLMKEKPESIALVAYSLRKQDPNALKLKIKELDLQKALLKYNPEYVQDSIHALKGIEEPIDIRVQRKTTAQECLDMRLINTDKDTFLWGFDHDEQPNTLKIRDKGFKVAIIGETNQGKTFEALSLTAQSRLKGYHGIYIDLHANSERSFKKYMGSLADSPSIFWCTRPEDVVDTLEMIHTMILSRFDNGFEHRVLIVIDDTLGIAGDDEYKDLFNKVLTKAVTEGPKVGVSVMLISHNWQAETISKKLRSNLSERIAYHCDSAESRLLFQNKKAANMTPALSPGHFVLLDAAKDVYELHAPHWTADTIDKIALMCDKTPIELGRVQTETTQPFLRRVK